MVRENPETLLHAHVLGGMCFEYRHEHSVLKPACVEFRIGFMYTFGLHVASDVVSPVSITYISRGRRKIGKITEHFPGGVGVAGEAQLVAMASDASPAVVDDGSWGIFSE